MQIKQLFTIIVVFFSLMMSSPRAQSETSEEIKLNQKIENYNLRLSFFEKVCLTKEGEINSVIRDSAGNTINCDEEAVALKNEDFALSAESACIEKNAQSFSTITQLSSQSLEAANTLACTKKEAEEDEVSCLKDMGCNALRSFMKLTPLGAGVNLLSTIQNKIQADQSSQKSCLSSNQSDCVSEIVAGILKDIWSNVDAIWGLLKSGAGWAEDKVVQGWKYFTDVEDKTTESAMLASQKNESWIKTFINSPGESLKKMGHDLYELVSNGIKDSFMCNRWAGAPHLSQCLEPQKEAWDCASCDQKMNSICGVAGFAAGEIATAYLTGGVLSLGKVALKSIGLTNATIELSKYLPRLSLANKARLLKIKKRSSAAIDKFTNHKVVASTGKAIKFVSYPLVQYIKLMDQAFTLGMKHGEYGLGNARVAEVQLPPNKSEPKNSKSEPDNSTVSNNNSSAPIVKNVEEELEELGKQIGEKGKLFGDLYKKDPKDKAISGLYFDLLKLTKKKLELEGFKVQVSLLNGKTPILKILSGPDQNILNGTYKSLSSTLKGAQDKLGLEFQVDPMIIATGALGSYGEGQIKLGLEHFTKPRTTLNSTILHEIRHAHFDKKRALAMKAGKANSTFYDVKVTSKDKKINVAGYESYMTFEELGTNVRQIAQSRQVKIYAGEKKSRQALPHLSHQSDIAFVQLVKRTLTIGKESFSVTQKSIEALKVAEKVEFPLDKPGKALIKLDDKEVEVSLMKMTDKMTREEKMDMLKSYLLGVEKNIRVQMGQVEKWYNEYKEIKSAPAEPINPQ